MAIAKYSPLCKLSDGHPLDDGYGYHIETEKDLAGCKEDDYILNEGLYREVWEQSIMGSEQFLEQLKYW